MANRVARHGVDADEICRAAVTGAAELAGLVQEHRRQGRRIVFTNGCFDLLHVGHAGYLAQARAFGDVLVVGVNSDASVRRLKGPARPVNPQQDRAALVASLRCVDHAVIFDDDTPLRLIEKLRPDVYVKGGDYRLATLPERAVVESYGGQVHIVDQVPHRSTSRLMERIAASRGAGSEV